MLFASATPPRLVRGSRREPEPLDDAAYAADLLSVAAGELALADPQAVFQADAHMGAHGGGHRRDRHLHAPGPQIRTSGNRAEEPVRRAPHVHHVFRMRTDAAEDAEHGLHQERQLDQPTFGEMSEVVQVTNVVAFELESGAVRRQCGHRELIPEGVAKHKIAGALQILPYPIVLELLEPVQLGEQAEVHRSHVERGRFRLEADGWLDALFDLHEGTAAARQVHDGVCALLDAREEGRESVRPLVGAPGLGVARREDAGSQRQLRRPRTQSRRSRSA